MQCQRKGRYNMYEVDEEHLLPLKICSFSLFNVSFISDGHSLQIQTSSPLTGMTSLFHNANVSRPLVWANSCPHDDPRQLTPTRRQPLSQFGLVLSANSPSEVSPCRFCFAGRLKSWTVETFVRLFIYGLFNDARTPTASDGRIQLHSVYQQP